MYSGAAFPASHRRDREMDNKPPSHAKSLENTAGFDLRTMTAKDLERIKSYYYGMISLNDKYIGRMLESLAGLGLAERTVVVATADHGEMLGDHGLLFKAGYMYDEVVHAPLMIRAPGKLPAGRRINALTEAIDIMPTALDLLGIRASARVQGRSLLPVIEGKQAGRQEVHSEFPTTKMIRTADWKLVHYVRAPYGELYNLREDPHELYNLYDDPGHAKVKSEMKSRLADWLVGERGSGAAACPRAESLKMKSRLVLLFCILPGWGLGQKPLSLNGTWEAGLERRYDREIAVPGLATDPSKITGGTLWYRRNVALPAGDWTHATLTLKGARFCPAVYVNGEKMFARAGGMTRVSGELKHPAVKPGGQIQLEIALLPLDRVDAGDASKTPAADLWRTNISSSIWDDVELRFHGGASIQNLFGTADLDHQRVDVKYRLASHGTAVAGLRLEVSIMAQNGRVVGRASKPVTAPSGNIPVAVGKACARWTPETPALYKIKATLQAGGKALDTREVSYGHRDFRIDGLRFKLNGDPYVLRAGTVVWPRWLRDPEAATLAWDETWFLENVVKQLKSRGANTLRFHLGMPPERFLDMCDREGLAVQAEWSFFHGMKGSYESLLEQWRAWFDACLRHPSVILLHAWNETDDPAELDIAFKALDAIAKDYPPLVIGHRDVIHVHKYWWSLFENLGCYYDSYKQFPKPIMVDEFGGNYLDGDANPGAYPTTASAYLRFLGRGHTREERLEHHAVSNARVAEYWRRLGAAGFSPFCILGSREDGNHWYLGPLREGRLKPVWDDLAASWSPVAASLEIWDRNFLPGQKIKAPLHLFNDLPASSAVACTVRIRNRNTGESVSRIEVVERLQPFSNAVKPLELVLPDKEGEWSFEARLEHAPSHVTRPVVSRWDFRTLRPRVSSRLRDLRVAVPAAERELREMLQAVGVAPVTEGSAEAKVLLLSKAAWEKPSVAELEKALRTGKHIVMLDSGPVHLGQGYLKNDQLGPLQGVMVLKDGKRETHALPFGVQARFQEIAEPESHVQPSAVDDGLWRGLPKQATWLWNGLRGGLVAPATGMELTGVKRAAFLESWKERGADPEMIKRGRCHAYELEGYYEFSGNARDQEAIRRLKQKVTFLVEDAPALKLRVNPDALVVEHDLGAGYLGASESAADRIVPLASCGKGLLRTPVFLVDYGPGRGRLLVSQLLTGGRLVPGAGEAGLYGRRYDPAAVQLVLNMIERVLEEKDR